MRVTNNLSQFLLSDRPVNDSKGTNSAVLGKVMEMVQASSGKQVTISALLVEIRDGMGKFLLPELGHLHIPIMKDSDLRESSRVTINFGMSNEGLTAEIIEKQEAGSSVQTPKTNKIDHILKQLGIAVTPQNQNAVNLLMEYNLEPSAERIKQFSEGSFLASRINDISAESGFEESLVSKDQQIEWTKTLKAVVIDWMNKAGVEKMPIDSAAKMANPTNALDNSIQIKPMLDQDKSLAVNKESNTMKLNDEQMLLSNVGENTSGTQETELSTLLKTLQKITPKTLLPLVASNMTFNLENVQRSDMVFSGSKNITLMKQALFEKMGNLFNQLDPNELLKSEIKTWLEDDGSEFLLRNQFQELEAILTKHSPEIATQLKENFEQVGKALNLLEQLPDQMMAFHLPVMMGDQPTQIELYLNKKRSKENKEDFKILLALNTATMGQVQVLVEDLKNQINLNFKLEDETIKDEFKKEEDTINAMITDLVEKKIKFTFGCHFNEPPVLVAMKELCSEQKQGIDVRV